MDKLEFLDAPQGANEEARTDDAAQAAAPAPEQVVETPPVPQTPTPEAKPVVPEGYVPLAVVLDTRDKLRDAEAKLALHQRQEAAPKAPDPDEDPEAFNRFQIDQTQGAILNARLDMSEELSREKHGDEIVDKARDWALQRFQNSPAYRAEVLAQRNPWGYVVEQFKRHDALEKLGGSSEIDAFLAWKAAQDGGTTTTPTVIADATAAPLQPAIPPRSIASAPSAGGGAAPVVPTGPGVAYANVFGN